MPHLNEMQQKFAEKGFTIIALTQSVDDAFMKEHKIAYPVGVGGPSANDYKVKGIPQTYLIDTRGKIVWEGHTASEQQVDELLAKVRTLPKRTWPKGLDKIAKAAQAGSLGEASKQLAKFQPSGQEEETAAAELKAFVDGKVTDLFAEVEELEKEEDYFSAQQILGGAKKSLAGHEGADKASEKLKEYDKDKKIKSAIKAGELFEKGATLEQQRKPKEALPFYVQAAKVGAGTKIGEKAKAKAQALSAQ